MAAPDDIVLYIWMYVDMTWLYVDTMWMNDQYFVRTYRHNTDGRYHKDLYYTWSQSNPGSGSQNSSRRYSERCIHTDTVYYYSGDYSLIFMVGPDIDLEDPRERE